SAAPKPAVGSPKAPESKGPSAVASPGPGVPAPGPGESPGSIGAPPSGSKPAPGGSPVLLATVGTYSGPVGGLFTNILSGAQVWMKDINARGGLNGHPVKIFVYDDGGDPARHRAQVQEAIKQRHI